MTGKTMDFKIYPARVEGEPELMNKPITEQDIIKDAIIKVYDEYDKDWADVVLVEKVLSAKRLLKSELPILTEHILLLINSLCAGNELEQMMYEEVRKEVEKINDLPDTCFQISDGDKK